MPVLDLPCHETAGSSFLNNELFCPVSEINKIADNIFLFTKNISQTTFLFNDFFLVAVFNFYFVLVIYLLIVLSGFSYGLDLLNIRHSLKKALAKGLIKNLVFD